MSDDLQTVIDITEDIRNSLTVADVVFWILIIVSIVIISFIVIMLGSVVFAMRGVSNVSFDVLIAVLSFIVAFILIFS